LDEAEEEKSRFEGRRARVREGVTGEEGIEGILCICLLLFRGAVDGSRRYHIAQKRCADKQDESGTERNYNMTGGCRIKVLEGLHPCVRYEQRVASALVKHEQWEMSKEK
jgi:hypothetical protein